jgi:hypothetical protein
MPDGVAGHSSTGFIAAIGCMFMFVLRWLVLPHAHK